MKLNPLKNTISLLKLISSFKKQYHKKIQFLENERKELLKEIQALREQKSPYILSKQVRMIQLPPQTAPKYFSKSAKTLQIDTPSLTTMAPTASFHGSSSVKLLRVV